MQRIDNNTHAISSHNGNQTVQQRRLHTKKTERLKQLPMKSVTGR